jgi:hypothetical protein
MASVLLSGCTFDDESTIINRYAEVLLTKRNEIQFRFKINPHIFSEQELYKVRVSIHNKQLAAALGTDEVIYGERFVYRGEFLEVDKQKDEVIYMEPIPLLKDLHVSEIKEMIRQRDAVSVEIFNDHKVLGKSFLTHFSSQL